MLHTGQFVFWNIVPLKKDEENISFEHFISSINILN